jgi:hypothetical protein
MSAFSRGCLLRQQCAFRPRTIHLCFGPTSFQRSQFFSTSPFLHAGKKARPPPIIKKALPNTNPSFKPTKSSAPAPTTSPTYQSYAMTLAQKQHPTLLYHAPPHTMFMIACYSGAGFCFSYAVINFWSTTINPPENVTYWVPYALAGVSFFMVAFGTWLVLGPARLIKSITAIPRNSNAISNAVGKSASPALEIEVELRKMFPLPFFPARKLYVKPEEISLPTSLGPTTSKVLTPAEVRATRLAEEQERQRLLEYQRNHILTLPFRQISQLFFKMFKAVGRSWHREGFLKVDVKGSKYKLDVTGGWALDGGRALDRLAGIKPNL